MKVGFTGTRDGLTTEQRIALATCFIRWTHDPSSPMSEFHHGCCTGADEQASAMLFHGAPPVRIVAHPPNSDALLADESVYCSDEVRPRLPYLDRNRNIVDACEVLVACPKGPEEMRSGTWATVRYARKKGKRVVVVWPNGEVTEE